MATQAERPAAPPPKGIVHVQTQGSFGSGDKVRMTTHGCFLKDRVREIRCCNCFAVQFKEIKADWQTTVEGLQKTLKHDVILADLKKILHCHGYIEKNKEDEVVIRLYTERAQEVKEFLWKKGLAAKDKIHINCPGCG